MAASDPDFFPVEEENPYAAPRSESKPEAAFLGMTPVAMTIGDVLERSWQIYRDRMGQCLGVFGVGVVLMLGAYAALFLINWTMQGSDLTAALVGLVAMVTIGVFFIWMMLGFVSAGLAIAQGREASVGSLFSGGRFVFRTMLASVVFTLALYGTLGAVFLVGLVLFGLLKALVPDLNAVIPALIIVVFGITGYVLMIIVMMRLMPFWFVIVDRWRRHSSESLRISFRITKRAMPGRKLFIALFFAHLP